MKELWLKLRNNRWFVAFYTSLGTVVFAQASAYYSGGAFSTSSQFWIKTLVGAALVATASVYHVNLPAPGAPSAPK